MGNGQRYMRRAKVGPLDDRPRTISAPYGVPIAPPDPPVTGDRLKGRPLTISALAAILGLVLTVLAGAYAAYTSMADRADSRRSTAIRNHDHNDSAHGGLRRELADVERRLGKRLAEVAEQLKRIDRRLSRAARRPVP